MSDKKPACVGCKGCKVCRPPMNNKDYEILDHWWPMNDIDSRKSKANP